MSGAGDLLCGDGAEIECGLFGLAAANRAAKETGSLSRRRHILNAPTRLMKSFGYGERYE